MESLATIRKGGLRSSWLGLCRVKEEKNRLSEEVRDRDEMDPVLLTAMGAAVSSRTMEASSPKFQIDTGVEKNNVSI